jgi:hypothetical protein
LGFLGLHRRRDWLPFCWVYAMSYARWSNSNWYAFDNVNGLFSLWHVSIGDNPDHDYDVLLEMRDSGTLLEWLRVQYPGLGDHDAEEAIRIVVSALEKD